MTARDSAPGRLRAFAASLVLVAACSAPRSVYLPASPGAELKGDAVLEASSALDRAWLCLLHGRGCQHLDRDVQKAVAAGPRMIAAQFTRALALQPRASIAARSLAWLDLLLWLEVARPAAVPAAKTRRSKLSVVAMETLARLAVRDRRAVVGALRARRSAVVSALAACRDPLEQFRLRRAVHAITGGHAARFFGRAVSLGRAISLGRAGGPVHGPAVTVSRRPVHQRMHTGARYLASRPQMGPRFTVNADPHRPFLYRLPASRPGVHLVELALPPRAEADYVVIGTPRAMVVWLGQTKVSAQEASASGRFVAIAVPASKTTRVLSLAISLASGGGTLECWWPSQPAANSPAKPAAHPPAKAARSAAAVLEAPTGAALDVLYQLGSTLADSSQSSPAHALLGRFARGPLLSMLHLERRASLDDHTPRASAVVLDTVLSHFPGHVDARIERAARARDDGDAALARRLLAPLVTPRSAPVEGEQRNIGLRNRADLHLERARQAMGDGLADLALAEAELATDRQRGDCAVARAALHLALNAMNKPAIKRLLARPQCTQPSLDRADALLALGDPGLAATTAFAAAVKLPHLRLEAARKGADAAATAGPAAVGSVALFRAHLPGHEANWRALQAQLVSAGAADPAVARKLDSLLLDPRVRSLQTRRGYFLLGARPPWQRFIIDGAKAVATWRKNCAKNAASCVGEGAPVTYLIDQEIDFLLPTGGAIRRVHQALVVHTAQAAESLGELQVPADAELILARAHSSDGTIVLPAATPDKESVSLRKVVPGAVIEHVQVQFTPPDDSAVATTRLPPFMLASSDGPVHRSELVVMVAGAPEHPPADFSASAPPPTVLDLSIAAGPGEPKRAFRTWTWRTTGQARVRPEARAVRPQWSIPAVRVRQNATHVFMVQRFEEVLAAYLSHEHAALQPWLAKARAAGQDAERWRLLIAEVASAVVFARSGMDPGPPASAARNGKGDRATLLWYLARKTGVGACLCRWQPLTRTPAYGAPDPRDFSATALRLTFRPPGGAPRTTWIDPGVAGGVLDYLRPGLRGPAALLLGCDDRTDGAGGQTQITLPNLGASHDRRSISMTITWAADGSATAAITDSMGGALAALVRNYADAPKNRANLVQQLGRSALPGWSLRWQGAAEEAGSTGRLTVRYTGQRAASASNKEQLTLGLFPARLGRIYARLPSRRTDLRFGHGFDTEVVLKLRNEGGPLAATPAAQSFYHPRATLQRSVNQLDNTIHVGSRLRASMGIVPAGRYGQFAKHLRAIDRAEMLHLQRAQQGNDRR